MKLFRKIKSIILHFRVQRKIKLAVKLAAQSKMKYLVLMYNGSPRVFSKQRLTRMVRTRQFKKGVKVADLEKQALFITT